MKVAISIPISVTNAGYPSFEERCTILNGVLAGRLGNWFAIHGITPDIYDGSMFIAFECDDEQYIECLLGFDGDYIVEIISN